ncbi:MAG: endonuclease [Candidatus Syntrophosphaera sp.]
MTKTFLLVIMLMFAALAFGQGNYYDAVLDLTGNELYTGLHGLISTNYYNSYDGAKVFLFQELDNVDGNVICVYTGEVYYVGYDYTGSTNPNTEHTYAQSWFEVENDPVRRSDLHHLFPTTMQVNSARGNLPIFTVADHFSYTTDVYYYSTPWQSFRGLSSTGCTVFEPADESKGNIARALLYFNTRYYDTLVQQNVDMVPDLVQWHYSDPPDSVEIARNEAIQGFQTNRNPYVDHPEFVGLIWGGSSTGDESLPPAPRLALEKIYPNPFKGSTTLSVKSLESLLADVCVYNARGQKVTAWKRAVNSGDNQIIWDGTGRDGKRLPAGIYLIRVSVENSSLTGKVFLK